MEHTKMMQGIALGLIAGAVVGAAAAAQRVPMKRAASKAIRAVGNAAEDAIEHVSDAMGL